MGAIGWPFCLGRMALLLLSAASATLPAILAHKSSLETRPPPREGILSRVAGRKASGVGNGCLRSPGLFMLPGRLVVRTRCQGAAPLGGPFTFLTGSSHCRSSQRPPATSSATAAMPLRVPITSGRKAPPPFCCTREGWCTALLPVDGVDGVEAGVGLGLPPGCPVADGVVALPGGAALAGTVAFVVGVAVNGGEGAGAGVAGGAVGGHGRGV